ncbi:MAG: HAMP domain-containing histidine kinase [Lachnospiraceae bacterium]|jgi:signal transduction histidine kinase|nr:HAMP domain-containing histidine kinase [Lachnospiraceae bacterium]
MILSYIRDRRRGAALLLFCTGIFLLVFWLERLSFRAVGYAFLLCSVFLGCVILGDFFYYRKRHRELRWLLERPLAELSLLPEAGSGEAALWRALVKQEWEAGRRLSEEVQAERRDQLDYYTMWVHQVKTPIAAMKLLLDENEAGDRTLLAELFAVEQYVGMVLSYLRLSGDGTDFVIRRIPLLPLVRQTVRKFAPLFIRKKLSFSLEDVDGEALTDEKWLSFALEQLLSNALKYTREGGIRIYMEPGKTLVIEDTGIGIDPADLPRIWERGFTGTNGRTVESSTGIGLYLCREICKKLSHEITIESEPGAGTKVCIRMDEAKVRPE